LFSSVILSTIRKVSVHFCLFSVALLECII
jgi:hypothetical protein